MNWIVFLRLVLFPFSNKVKNVFWDHNDTIRAKIIFLKKHVFNILAASSEGGKTPPKRFVCFSFVCLDFLAYQPL